MAGFTWADQGGGTYANPELSSKLRFQNSLQSRFFECVEPGGDVALSKNHGDTVALKLWGRNTTVATTALSETGTVPYITLPEYTVTAQVFQRGVAMAWTGQREDLDRLAVEDPIIHGLKDHSSRTHNKLIYDALVAGRSFCYTPLSASTGNFTTNGSPTGTAAVNFSGFHVRNIVKNLKKYNVAPFDGDNYLCIGSPTMLAGLFEDGSVSGGFVDVQKYSPTYADGLINGEIGKYFKTRFVEDNDVLNGSLDAIGSGSAFGSGFFLGAEACKEISVYPMELRANMNLGGDYGRQKGIAWLSLLAYKTIGNYTTHGIGFGSVCHYTSA